MNHHFWLADFTDEGCFGALTALSGASELRCGALNLRQKLLQRLQNNISEVRLFDKISPWDRHSDALFSNPTHFAETVLSSRCILSQEAADYLLGSERNEIYQTNDGKIIGCRFDSGFSSIENLKSMIATAKLPIHQLNAIRIDYPWHLLKFNESEIAADLMMVESIDKGISPHIPNDVFVRGLENIKITGDVEFGVGATISAEKSNVRIEQHSSIGPGSILSAQDGPIWIGENVVIEPGAIIQGPAYIGQNSIVRAGARLNGGVSLGVHCRVGGELSNVIMQGFSNKQHSGYIGGAVIGQWVNLGAATDNSDLKNNYRPIDVTLDGKKIDSGELHLGVIIGDFVRTAIQTRLNSGTVVGTCCNIFGNDFPDKAIPPFIWFGSDGYQEYRLDKALDTIKIVLSRRSMILHEQLEKALTDIFSSTRKEREQFLRSQ